MSFSLTDVTIGSTYMKGKTTMGVDAVGRVVAVLPGIGFRVRDCDGRGFMLWSDLQLVDEETYDLANETVDDSRAPGFPDCAFWESRGIEPLFVASWCHYMSDPVPPPPGYLTPILSERRAEAEAKGGAYLRAWSRQATECLAYTISRSDAPALTLRDFPGSGFETPKRQRVEVPVPDAPARPSRKDEDETEDELPPLDASEDEDEEQAEEQEEADEDEEAEEAEEAEENKEQDWLGLAKIVTFLKAPNTIPIAVLVGWVAYLTVQNYCSCP